MKHKSYLLAIDGSIESRAAAYLAWDLAKKTGARVVAQHVINVRDTWRFLRPKSAGLIGSGPYIEAFESITSGLRSIAEALMLSYRTQAEGQNIQFETHIDEGDLVAEISKRAKEHDLLIVGHRIIASSASSLSEDYSVCEELAQLCSCPMLIVSSNCNHWRQMHINVTSTKIDPALIESISEFGQALGLHTQLYISPLIPTSEAKNWIDTLPLQHNAKSWDIYMDGDGQKPAYPDELPVLVPTINGCGSLNGKQFRSYISEFSPPALLLWRQQYQTRNKMSTKHGISNNKHNSEQIN